jgi:carbamoyltransferase
MGYTLAFHAGHNSSALIGDETGILYAIQEERLNQEKNYWGFPRLALRSCLEHVGATVADVKQIAYGGHQVFSRYHSRDDVIESYKRQETLRGKLRQRVVVPMVLAVRPDYGQRGLKKMLADEGMGSIPLVHYDHHLCHATSAYFGLRKSAERPYLVLSCDGSGDDQCASVSVMGGGKLRMVAQTNWGNSLGAIYSWITYGMGFVPFEHEYKLMGMAPYASPSAARAAAQIFHRYLGLSGNGLSFRRKTLKRTSDVAGNLFEDLRGERFDHVCAGLQLFTEDILCEWTQHAVRATGVRDVLAAGGVFMNVKANKRISELPEVDSFEAFPSCGDETLPFGAFFLALRDQIGDAQVKGLSHFYLGDAPDEGQSLAAIQKSGYRHTKPESMAREVAELLASGHPVARCAGPMEFGARALGNRSILADPKDQDVVRVINRMVKKRDFWMPFAPMVLDRRQDDYIKNPKKLSSPYMMMTFDTRDNFRDLIAAVHNADLTCRAQILERPMNPAMYDIVEAFEAKTGRGVVLNTSFNLHGFPIVRTAEEALHVFRESGLEHLQIGDRLVHKN